MPNDVRVYGATVKDELNEDLWSGFRMKDHVRKALLKIADKFYTFTGTDLPIEDIHVVGSNASYNWTATSDIDLHLILDFNEFSTEDEKKEILRQKFIGKKRIFNDQYEIDIYGHEVELYVEDVDDYNASDGIFSVLNGVWIRKPERVEHDVNRVTVQKRTKYFMNLIDRLEVIIDPVDKFETSMRIKDELVNLRQSSLETDGNFSVGNLVFKSLRSAGYINKLFDYMNDSYGESLSLTEHKGVNVKLVLEALSQEQVESAEELGMEYVDEQSIGDYDLAIFRLDRGYSSALNGTQYQIGLQRKGRDFTSFEDQNRVEMPDSLDRTVIPEMFKTIKKWNKKYGDIAVGSMNPKKTKQYKEWLSRAGFTTETAQTFLGEILIVSN